MSQSNVKFPSVSIGIGASSIWGAAGSTNDQKSENLVNMNIHNISTKSAGASVATITFDKGDGFIGTQTQAANTSVSYYEPGVKSITIANATAAATYIVQSQKGY